MTSTTRQPRRSVSGTSMLLAIVVVAVVLLLLGLDTRARAPVRPPSPGWRPLLAEAEAALAAGDVQGAVARWREARRRAMAAPTWEGLLDVGAAYRSLGDTAGFAQDATATARRLFLAAMFRARREGSLEGVLRAAEAFADLGDHEMVVACLGAAQALAGKNPALQARVLAAADRWTMQRQSRSPR